MRAAISSVLVGFSATYLFGSAKNGSSVTIGHVNTLPPSAGSAATASRHRLERRQARVADERQRVAEHLGGRLVALDERLVHGLHFERRQDVGGAIDAVERAGDLGVLAFVHHRRAAALAEVGGEHFLRRALVAQVVVDELLVGELRRIGLLEPARWLRRADCW